MKRYDKHKGSGVEWIGEIPEHWKIEKLRYIGNFTSSGIDKKVNKDEPCVKIINYTDVYGNSSKVLNSERNYMEVTCPEEKRVEHQVKRGDLIFTPSSETIEDIGLSALVEEDLENTAYSYHVLRFRFIINIDHNFKKYLCNNHLILNYFSANAKGTTRQILNRENFNNTLVILPPEPEQTAIADYLDKKTTQIDKLIFNKQNLIELLKEERLVMINQAVTKGLNHDSLDSHDYLDKNGLASRKSGKSLNQGNQGSRRFKPSGIGWLGDIPEHWGVKKLKYVVLKIGSGITPKGGANVYQLEGIPLLRSQNVYNDGLRLEDVAYISEEIDEEMSNSRIAEGDVLLNITGASIGRCFYVPEGFGKGNVNQHVCIVRPINTKILTKYLHLLIISRYVQTLIDFFQTGANREGLNFQQIKSFDLPLPNVDEQEKIINQIESETERIITTITKVEREIELLQEYRTALISEAVTGKIKV